MDSSQGNSSISDATKPDTPPLDPATMAALAAEYSGGRVVIASIVCTCISLIFVGLRFYTRTCIVRALNASDWLILSALGFSIGTTACLIFQASNGTMGRHLITIPPERFIHSGKAFYAGTLLYICGLVAVKLSILVLYLRILNTVAIHRVCYAVMAVILLFGLFSILTNIFTCWPIAKVWNPFLNQDGFCFPLHKMWADVSAHIIGEILIMILPLPFVLKLRMPRGQKAAVCGLFMMGIFLVIVSLLRIPSLNKIANSTDPTWDGVPSAIWSSVEVNVAIICACCMTLRPLAAYLLPGLISSSYVLPSDGSSGSRKSAQAGQFPLTIGTRRERPLPSSDSMDWHAPPAKVLLKNSSKISSRSPLDLEKGFFL